jgi:hypothetical protein
LLLAAHVERPDLAPGTRIRKGLRRHTIGAVLPAAFQDSVAFKEASGSPSRLPTLLKGAEWCLPIGTDASVFVAPTPNGTVVTIGSVDRLLAELHDLNESTLRMTPADMD